MVDPGFPRGGGANSRGVPTCDFDRFSQKLHEIERGASLAPPQIRHWSLLSVCVCVMVLSCKNLAKTKNFVSKNIFRGVCLYTGWGRWSVSGETPPT